MKLHELGNLFPAMPDADYEALKRSIADHGLFEPIVLYQDRILDGRHRWRGCKELGIEPPTVQFKGPDPLAFVLAKNLHRRHLDESQRAMVAARISTLEWGGDRKSGDFKENIKAEISAVTQGSAAKHLNVSPDSIQAARKVLQHGAPDLVKAVDGGRIAVSAAKAIACLSDRDQQRVVLEDDPRKRRELIRRARDEAAAKAATAREQRTQERSELILTVQPGKGSLGPITLAQWAKLGKEERVAALTCPHCGAKLNPQDTTFIEWARFSWNPETGCLHDCPYCYARDIAEGRR